MTRDITPLDRQPLIRLLCFCAFAAVLVVHAAGATYHNPVLAGDYPDPSVVRIGDDYWATATTSEWAPLFPVLHSRDLVNWEHAANVFERRPDWAVGNFWAPEIWQHNGKCFVYYVGRKRGGALAVAVATADRPAGPWTDHGPLVSQEMGSIDPVPVADTDGTLYLIWKEDGNSRGKPTPLWIQKLSADGTKLVGDMKEILRNDADWEKNLVEGPYVQRHGDYWYLFYSGSGCCGRGCSYALGVARARNLSGPWEKCPLNPLLAGNETWKCPGHGSIVTDASGRDWLLYHAYDTKTFIYVGRQGLLDAVTWNDGWPAINRGAGPSVESTAPLPAIQQPVVDFVDRFESGKLKPQWQWPQNNEPRVAVHGGTLTLTATHSADDLFAAAVIALRTTTGDYTASARIEVSSLSSGQSAGLAAFGDRDNALGASVRGRQLLVWKRQHGKQEMLATNQLGNVPAVFVRMNAGSGHQFSFAVSGDGRSWKPAGENIDVEGSYLPPWDRGVRVALVAGGPTAQGMFGDVRVSAVRR